MGERKIQFLKKNFLLSNPVIYNIFVIKKSSRLQKSKNQQISSYVASNFIKIHYSDILGLLEYVKN